MNRTSAVSQSRPPCGDGPVATTRPRRPTRRSLSDADGVKRANRSPHWMAPTRRGRPNGPDHSELKNWPELSCEGTRDLAWSSLEIEGRRRWAALPIGSMAATSSSGRVYVRQRMGVVSSQSVMPANGGPYGSSMQSTPGRQQRPNAGPCELLLTINSACG